jgi:hypothetical protein
MEADMTVVRGHSAFDPQTCVAQDFRIAKRTLTHSASRHLLFLLLAPWSDGSAKNRREKVCLNHCQDSFSSFEILCMQAFRELLEHR